MALFHLILVSLVQGITEFLPISSSAHLILIPKVTGLPDQGPVIDVAVHVGTLLAVLLYFRTEVVSVARGGVALFNRSKTETNRRDARLFLALLMGTIPVVIAGFALSRSHLMGALRDITVIGWTTLIFGILLWLADRFAMRVRSLDSVRLGDAVLIGLAQAVALIPGTSRSGITITAARALGFEREDAARFSMLLAIPTIAAAGILTTMDVLESGNLALGLDSLIAAGLSFAAAYLAIDLFLRWLRRASMTPFVIYRVALGVALLLIGHNIVTL